MLPITSFSHQNSLILDSATNFSFFGHKGPEIDGLYVGSLIVLNDFLMDGFAVGFCDGRDV